jgi:hypothetical protein
MEQCHFTHGRSNTARFHNYSPMSVINGSDAFSSYETVNWSQSRLFWFGG